ncbi:MAG: hypothetical protein E6I97_15220 [Chloroflexi bacterium]|nr:MAG: hypothetical protein E6I97_15220 [Chloroflexota bacterium]
MPAAALAPLLLSCMTLGWWTVWWIVPVEKKTFYRGIATFFTIFTIAVIVFTFLFLNSHYVRF